MFREPLCTMTAPTFPSYRREPVPLWPSGAARVDDGVLEILSGDGLQVALRDVTDISLEPALGARLLLAVSHRKGLTTVQRRFWVAREDHDALMRLIREVAGNRRMRAAGFRETAPDARQRPDRR